MAILLSKWRAARKAAIIAWIQNGALLFFLTIGP
jgi:hypothetical protein